MRAWVVLLGLLFFGLILICGGVADRDPDDRLARWLSIAVGTGFCVLAALIAVFGHANTMLPFPDADRGVMVRFGGVLSLAGIVTTAYAIVSYFVMRSHAPDPNLMAPWIKWVYLAGSFFVLMAGIALVVAGLSGRVK